MESVGAERRTATDWSTKRSLSRISSSFRLRCSSLNSLRLRRVFDLFDKNGDGVITADEIDQALVILGLEPDPSDSALDSFIKSFIIEGNEGLTFDDFEALHGSLNATFFQDDRGEETESEENLQLKNECQEDRMSQVESDLTEAFKVFDLNGDGFISAKELQVVLDKLGLPEAKEMNRVDRMISNVDQNHDGFVDFLEFKDMMRPVVIPSS
ncbi:hypothetical protein Nepgr_028236 [Nepenthes gracilis]|uniref:EF-hand domain-containing protein n=1 Tax=Nepenthes gracilis TaxID=150966 RepID=A0AAD3TBY9_NEPGR|nr:hypothetical protein Nepgr_028236 [Nepenthes gracilis]